MVLSLKAHKRKWRWREAVILVLAFFPYQFILGVGACRAVYRYIQGASNWEKTAPILDSIALSLKQCRDG